MNKAETVDFVIQELGKHHPHNDIIEVLCVKTGMAWSEAEQFVHQVEADNKQTITAKQSPLIIVMGITFILIGTGLTAYSAMYLVNFFQRDTLGMALGARSLILRIGSLVTGLGMIIGGIVGMWKTIQELFGGE